MADPDSTALGRPGGAAPTFGELLARPEPVFLMEAHDGISAKIAETAGFEAVWASGLSISTSLARRDCNETSWSALLDVVAQMITACSVPVSWLAQQSGWELQ